MNIESPIFCIPTANPAKCGATFAKWKARGYRTAALTDGPDASRPDHCDFWMHIGGPAGGYRGWPWATNLLLRHVRYICPHNAFFIAGGDDMDPAPELDSVSIVRQCLERFGGTRGVMQPTGDPMGIDASGRCAAERICGSPWIGREFLLTHDGGQGPGDGVFNERFHHFFADEWLKEQTERAGLLWQRKDLTHFHHHPTRTGEPSPPYMQANQNHWAADEAVFRELVATRDRVHVS